ncbi:EpsI family protein [Hahella sp. CR1]|uniref:exosortase-associated protein EpsI, B-type n=1 Tax=Hahella sp. CR1 TaxID=2992807 RepID=UPI0024411727|nr:exosortase-associated protein EpsI, B-type [Hahella sp. CR1]MDG9669480.1 EpsI family protein [Hahella sp. CR1]
MRNHKTSLIACAAMVISAVSAYALTPREMLSDHIAKVKLDAMIPEVFGGWREVTHSTNQIVDPQTRETINRIYNQTLSRTYVDESGYRVMVSIAYGEDQRDAIQMHYPEVCYPAQGFTLADKTSGLLQTDYGQIRITRLLTSQGQRHEPVTYWATVGEKVIANKVDKKLKEVSYGFRGYIPDGLLFRVSSVDKDSLRAFQKQRELVDALLTEISPASRQRLAGLTQ